MTQQQIGDRLKQNIEETYKYVKSLEKQLKETKADKLAYGNALIEIRDGQADRDSVICNSINNVLNK